MRVPRRVIAALAVIAASAGAGWFRPVPEDVAPGSLPVESWSLPSLEAIERSSAASAAQARSVNWVGGAAGEGTGDTSAGQTTWTLLGVVLDRKVPTALVRVGDKPELLRVAAGNTLPDGTRLVAVERGAVVVDARGCRQRRTVYADGAQADLNKADACGATQGNEEQDIP